MKHTYELCVAGYFSNAKNDQSSIVKCEQIGFIAVSWETEKKGPCCSVGDFALWCELTPNLDVVVAEAGVVELAIGEIDDKTENESESSNEGERGRGEVLVLGLLGPTEDVLLFDGLLDVGGGAANVLFGAVSKEGKFWEFMLNVEKKWNCLTTTLDALTFSLHTHTHTPIKDLSAFLSNVSFTGPNLFILVPLLKVSLFLFSFSFHFSPFSTRYKNVKQHQGCVSF